MPWETKSTGATLNALRPAPISANTPCPSASCMIRPISSWSCLAPADRRLRYHSEFLARFWDTALSAPKASENPFTTSLIPAPIFRSGSARGRRKLSSGMVSSIAVTPIDSSVGALGLTRGRRATGFVGSSSSHSTPLSQDGFWDRVSSSATLSSLSSQSISLSQDAGLGSEVDFSSSSSSHSISSSQLLVAIMGFLFFIGPSASGTFCLLSNIVNLLKRKSRPITGWSGCHHTKQ